MKISIVIPTKDREHDLIECIESVANQTRLPKEVIVVDDGNISQNTYQRIFDILNGINVDFIYLKKDKPGTSKSRNLGAEKSSSDVVIILDDDVILDEDFIEELLKVYDNFSAENLGGVGGIIKNARRKLPLENLFNYLFCMHSKKNEWDILPWGFQTWNEKISKLQKGNYMHGGLSSYKRDVLTKLKFREFRHGGRCANEDVEFFLRASKEYDFIITPHAKAFHKESPIGRESYFKTGVKTAFNRVDTFIVAADKTMKKNYFCFSWAMLGSILKQFLSVILDKKRRVSHLYVAVGMLVGLFQYAIYGIFSTRNHQASEKSLK